MDTGLQECIISLQHKRKFYNKLYQNMAGDSLLFHVSFKIENNGYSWGTYKHGGNICEEDGMYQHQDGNLIPLSLEGVQRIKRINIKRRFN